MACKSTPKPQKKNAPADVAASREPVSSKGPSTAHKVRQNVEPVNVLVGEIVRRDDGAQVIAARAADTDWTLTKLADDDVPRIRDIDLAERLGFGQPRMIRKMIARHVAAGNIGPQSRSTVERQRTRHGGEREYTVPEYWLTLEEALFITTQSETKRAVFVTKIMIAVFAAVMRGQTHAAPLPAGVAEAIEGLRADLAETKREYKELVQLVTRSATHRADSLSKRINSAADMTATATKRSFKSCRMEIESVIRDRCGYPRSPRNTFEAMPVHIWEQAMLYAEQEHYRAERLSGALAQATFKVVS